MGRLHNTLLICGAVTVTVFLLKRVLGVFAITVPLLYMFFDVNYSLRLLWVWIRIFILKRKARLLDTSAISFYVLPSDLDIFLHMNNARYLRELDFARFSHFLGSGLTSALKMLGCGFILGAVTMRYRRSLELFQKIKLQSKIIYWDNKAFYFEHQFINKDGFVHAVAFSKVVVVQTRKKSDPDTPTMLFEKVLGKGVSSPPPPKDLEYWLDYNSLSSLSLKH